MLRAVLDVNVLVSGTITSKGPAGVILRQWEAGVFTLVTCEELIATYEETMARPKILNKYRGITRETITASGTTLREFSEVVTFTGPIPRIVPNEADDDIVLECAVAGTVDYLVTGDRKHLLPLREHRGIPIVPPSAFVELLREDRARTEAMIEEETEPE